MKFTRILSYILLVVTLGGILVFLALNPDTLAHFLNGVIMIALPLILAMLASRRLKTEWRIFGWGALAFVGSQALHLPFNKWLLEPLFTKLGLETAPNSTGLLLIGLLAGLSAGLFEETARLVVLRRWLPDVRRWKDGLMFGLGHGGTEAMLLGALVIYVFLQAVVMRDASQETLVLMVGPDRVEATQEFLRTYWRATWYDSLLGALERISAIAVQASLALLVLQVNRCGQIRWYWFAVLYHTLVDMIAVYGASSWGIYVTEGVILVLAAFSLGMIFWLRRNDPPEAETQPISAGFPPKPAQITPEITSERLSESQYED